MSSSALAYNHALSPTALSEEAVPVDRTHRVARSRYTAEGRSTIRYPIVPVGDSIRSNVLEENGKRRIHYPGIGWQILQPAPRPGEKLASSAVLDVFVCLSLLFKLAGYPKDGRVYFTRYQLMLLMGWLSTSNGPSGQTVSKPSGRHYRQLKAALDYLEDTKFKNDDTSIIQIGPDGAVFRGEQGFPILQYKRLVADTPGPSGAGPVQSGTLSMVAFSWPFVEMLTATEDAVPMDFDMFLSLPSGTPRALFRFLSWARRDGVRRIRVAEVFESIGSTQTAYIPARARQILGKAHRELQRRAVIAEEPQYVQDEHGEYWVEYVYGDPALLLEPEELLVKQAVAYGVVPSTAREVTIANVDQTERVLAAVTLGLLKANRTLPGIVVSGVRRGYEIADYGHRVGAEDTQFSFDYELPEMRYIRWCARERQERLELRPDISVDDLRRMVEERNTLREEPHPEWVTEGLLAVRLNQVLGIESFATWRARARADD